MWYLQEYRGNDGKPVYIVSDTADAFQAARNESDKYFGLAWYSNTAGLTVALNKLEINRAAFRAGYALVRPIKRTLATGTYEDMHALLKVMGEGG